MMHFCAMNGLVLLFIAIVLMLVTLYMILFHGSDEDD